MLKKKITLTHTFCVCACVHTPVRICVRTKSLQSYPTLCDPMDCSLLGSSVRGDSQGKIAGVGCPSRTLPNLCIKTKCHISCICKCVSYHYATWEAQTHTLHYKLTQNFDQSPKTRLHLVLWHLSYTLDLQWDNGN